MTRWLAGALGVSLASSALAGPGAYQPSGDLDAAYAARRVAILVGVDQYGDADLDALSFAGKDARDMASTLGRADVGGFDELVVLDQASETTRDAILARIRELTAGLQRDDTFLLYLSGHGTLTVDPVDGTRLYFLPSDAELDQPEKRGLRVSELESMLSELVPRRRVLILDTCHNGRSKSGLSDETQTQLRGFRGEPPAPRAVTEVSESEARLYAAQYYQPAIEDKTLENGVYTHFLLESLEGERDTADLDRDGLVDVAEAHAYAQDRTIRFTGGIQVPRAEYRIVGNEEIFLSGDPRRRKSAETALFSAYSGLLSNTRLLVNGQTRGSLPGLHAIEPGSHRIEVQTADGRTIGTRRVRVRAGTFHHLEDVLQPARPQFWLRLGGNYSHGPGTSFTPRAQGEIELAVNTAPQRSFLVPEAMVRATVGRERVDDLRAVSAEPATAGTLSVGGALLAMPGQGQLGVGLGLEAVLPWRMFSTDDQRYAQVTATVAPSARAQVQFPVTRAISAGLRYDVRVLPWRHRLENESAWTSVVTHSMVLGVGFR